MNTSLLLIITILFSSSSTLCESFAEPHQKSYLSHTLKNDSTLKDDKCKSNQDCNYPHGYCVEDTCSCRLFYSGTYCDNEWKQNETFNGLYNGYSVWVILTQLICVVIAGYQIYITFKHATTGRWNKFNVTTYQIFIIFAAGIVRIVSFSVDPRGYRGIISPVADEFLFNLSVIMWLCAAFMTFLYWLELQTTSIKELVSLSVYRPYLIIFLVVCMIIIVPVSVWRAVANTPLSFLLYMSSIGVITIALIILASVAGFNLIRVIKLGNRKLIFGSAAMQQFVNHMIFYIISLDCLLASIAITLAIYLIIHTAQNMWKFIVMNFLLRTEEFLMIIISLWFIRKKKPKTPSDPHSMEGRTTRSSSFASKAEFELRSASQSSYVSVNV